MSKLHVTRRCGVPRLVYDASAGANGPRLHIRPRSRADEQPTWKINDLLAIWYISTRFPHSSEIIKSGICRPKSRSIRLPVSHSRRGRANRKIKRTRMNWSRFTYLVAESRYSDTTNRSAPAFVTAFNCRCSRRYIAAKQPRVHRN